MKLQRYMVYALSLALAAGPAAAQQYPSPPPPDAQAAPAQAPAALYAPAQLDQMVASIALYPDPLLTEILTAATYPLEIDQAAHWLQYPQDAALRGDDLANALAQQNWDPSVKSLVPFPQVLNLMDQHLDWTQALGNAFLAQQSDVMDSIQRLRQEALRSGTLVSSPYETVVADGPYIQIQPANPQTLYVPVYDPSAVYGAWPYPQDPPYYWGPPPGLTANFAVGALGFGVGIGIVDALWGWGDWDWGHHDVRIDDNRFNRINAGHPPVAAATWQHDPSHRAGVPYREAHSQAQFQQPLPGSADARRQYRFYPNQAQGNAAPAQQQGRQTQPQQERRTAMPQQQARTPPQEARTTPQASQPAPRGEPSQQQARTPAPPQQQQQARTPASPQAAAPARRGEPPQQQARTPPQQQQARPPVPAQQPQARAPSPQARAPSPPPVVARPAPPPPQQARAPSPPPRAPTAFQNFARSPQAQAEAQRGAQSRQVAAAPTPPRPAPAPAARPAAPPPAAHPAAPAQPQRNPREEHK